jgi:ribosomal protein S19
VVSASPLISTDRGEKPDMQKEAEIVRSSAPETTGNRAVKPEVKTDQKEACTPPEMVGIEVLNGNGVNRMARMVGDYLSEREFLVLSPKNADHFNHVETRIHYCIGYLQDAYRVAKLIPGYQNMDKAKQFEDSNAKVKVVIGRDMIPFKDVFRRPIADRIRLSSIH